METTNAMHGGVAARINVTPMIDILLVVMIIFMVMAPLSPVGLRALVPQPPQDDGTGQAAGNEIVVTIKRGGTILINYEPVERDRLQERLHTIFARAANGVVFVRGEDGLEYRDVARVIDLARGAGIARVALMRMQ